MDKMIFFLDPKKEHLSDRCKALVLSSNSLVKKYRSLKTYLLKNEIQFSSKEYASFQEVFECNLNLQLLKLSCLYFQIIILSNEWGHAGEQQVRSSFGSFSI